MAATAAPVSATHEQFVPHSGPQALPSPWVTLATSTRVTAQRVQNTTSAALRVETGTALTPIVLQPGDTLFAWADDSRRAIVRVPYCGRRFTTVRRIHAAANALVDNPIGTPDALGLTADESNLILLAGVLRGDCGGLNSGIVTIKHTGSDLSGLPTTASVTGIATNDAAGNIGASIAGLVTDPGTISLGVQGGASGPCDFGNVNGRFLIVCASEPLAFGDRIRSNVSEDAGSIFQATQAVAVELGCREAFQYDEAIPSGALRVFAEALAPGEVAARYYALPTRNQEMLTTVDGETNLGRLASTMPDALMAPASSIPGAAGGVVTAQQAIQHVVNNWAAAHPWLVFEAVPDLRLVEPGAVGNERQHYIDNPGAGILTTAAVVIPQDGADRRSMREILDEWLSIFPGTVVRQNSSGAIELVPRVGPNAPVDVAETLTWVDLLALSDGEDDPSGVTNRARVTSQGWEFTENQALRAPAIVVFAENGGINRDVLDGEEVIPDAVEEFQPWSVLPFTVLVDAGTVVTVDVIITAFGSWSPTTSSSFSVEGTTSANLTLAVGQAKDVSITHNSRSQNVTAKWRVRRSSSVALEVEPVSVPGSAGNPFGRTWFAYLLELDVTGTAWVRSNEAINSEFGQAGTNLPAPGGGDAIVDSRAIYGERLATLQSNVFQLTNEQAQAVARSYVLWNINPRTIREVQQSEWNKYPVKFDHIGRLINLPNGERAVVENRAYSDSFAPLGGQMQSTFTAAVTEVVIDTSTDWLMLDNGDFFQLDSGDLVEAS